MSTPTPATDKAQAREGDWLLDTTAGWTKPESTLYQWVSQQSGYFDDHLPHEQRARLTMAMLRAFDTEMKSGASSSAVSDAKQSAASSATTAQPSTQPATPSPTEGDTNGKSVSAEPATPAAAGAKQSAAKP